MKLREFLDTIPQEITELRIIATKQQQILEDHIRRTEIAETRLNILSEELLSQGRSVIALQAHSETQKSLMTTLLKIFAGVVVGIILKIVLKY